MARNRTPKTVRMEFEGETSDPAGAYPMDDPRTIAIVLQTAYPSACNLKSTDVGRMAADVEVGELGNRHRRVFDCGDNTYASIIPLRPHLESIRCAG